MERTVGIVVKKSQMNTPSLRKRCLHLNLLETFAIKYPVSTFFYLGYRKDKLKQMIDNLRFEGALEEIDILMDPLYGLIKQN